MHTNLWNFSSFFYLTLTHSLTYPSNNKEVDDENICIFHACIDVMIKTHFMLLTYPTKEERKKKKQKGKISLFLVRNRLKWGRRLHLYKCKTYYYSRVVHLSLFFYFSPHFFFFVYFISSLWKHMKNGKLWKFYSSHLLFGKKTKKKIYKSFPFYSLAHSLIVVVRRWREEIFHKYWKK